MKLDHVACFVATRGLELWYCSLQMTCLSDECINPDFLYDIRINQLEFPWGN